MGFQEYWDAIEIPFYCLIGWSVLSVLLMYFQVASIVIIGIVTWLVIISVFVYIGYSTRDKGVKFSAKAAALAGCLAGLVGGIMSILTITLFPQVYASLIPQYIELGMSEEQAWQSLKIGSYIGIITGPLMYSLIGAGIAALTSKLAK